MAKTVSSSSEDSAIVQRHCRACTGHSIKAVLDYGSTPIADVLLDCAEQTSIYAPLSLIYCKDCNLLQLGESVSPSSVYNYAYPYFSSAIASLLARMKTLADELIRNYSLDQTSKVIEIASNDGYLLKHFKDQGLTPLGVEPAERQANAARQLGIETIGDFFDQPLAEKIIRQKGLFDLVLANNVIAHIPDITQVLDAIASLLKTDGVAVFEFHDAGELLDKAQFDTIYHQHIFYFTLTSFEPLLKTAGLFVHKVETVDAYGGALRIHASANAEIANQRLDLSVAQQREKEANAKIAEFSTYTDFAQRCERNKIALKQFIDELRQQGKSVAAYGAAAKACTLLNVCELGTQHIEYLLDQNTNKHHLFMSGNALPIFPVERLAQNPPDYLLILAWNYADEIMQQLNWYCDLGGQFIIPIPELTIQGHSK